MLRNASVYGGRQVTFITMITKTMPTVLLRPGEADRLLAGHPWVYQGAVQRLTQPAIDGEVVQVKDHRQRFIGVGFFNSKSKILVRILSPDRIEIDAANKSTRSSNQRNFQVNSTIENIIPCKTILFQLV